VLEIVAKERPIGAIVQFGGQTPLKLARASRRPACRSSAPRRSIDRRGPRALQRAPRASSVCAAPQRHGAQPRRGASPTRSATRWSCARPTCSAAGRWRSSTTIAGWPSTSAARWRSARAGRSCSTASSKTPSSRRRRHLRRRARVIGGIMEHIEQAGVHSGDSAARCRPTRSRDMQVEQIRATPKAWRWARRARPDERAVRGHCGTTTSTSSRSTRAQSRTVPFVSKAIGVPLAKLAAKVHGRADPRGSGLDARRSTPAGYFGQGAGLPVRQVPRRRHRARPGDALHRRGHGLRRKVRRWPSPRR
jgi:carbamoyl-phosphate synthase large subunit